MYAPPQVRAQAELELRRRRAKHEAEWQRCKADRAYFIDTYCQIYDATAREWVPFTLWQAQRTTLDMLHAHRLTVVLKARQLGLSWLVLADALHDLLFSPAATVLLFSRRDDEATYLLGDERLKGMYARLPAWMQARQQVTKSNDHEWQLSTGSVARAFPTSAGDSYTATLAIVDEADLVPDLNRLMRAVKPTIDGGGRMVLVSRADKSEPMSEFKAIYRGAKTGANGWASVFLPWHVRPSRDAAWYEAQRRDIVSRTTALDDLHEQYPATDTEALAPRSLDKRIPAEWLEQCYRERESLSLPTGAPSIPGLRLYALPRPGRQYVVGGDPAEGNPTSDDSALTVADKLTGEEVAALAGKFQPSTFAAHIDSIGTYFNRASVLVERNNHGHAVLLWLRDHSKLERLKGWDEKEGWLSNSRGKALLYDGLADAFRDSDTLLHSFSTWTQLASIEGASLLAPAGLPDDEADSYALANVARSRTGRPMSAAVGGKRTQIGVGAR